MPTARPVYEGDYSNTLDTIDDDGTVSVLDGSGLGVTSDVEFIEDHKTGGRPYK